MSAISRSFRLAAILIAAGCATVDLSDVRRHEQARDAAGLLECHAQAEDEQVRIAVIRALASMPESDAGRAHTIAQSQQATSPELRLEAVRALQRHPGEESTAALILALADAHPPVRQAARQALAARPEEARPPLLSASSSQPNPLVRQASIELLVQSASGHEAEIGPALTRAVRDDAPGVRLAAVNGIGRLGLSSERGLLMEIKRSDDDAQVRTGAERALGRLGGPPPEASAVLAVLPLKNETGEKTLDAFCTQAAEYLTARLAESGRCQVLDRARIDAALVEMKKLGVLLYDGDAPNAPEMGRFKLAQQLVYGSLQRHGEQYTLVLNRMRVSTLELVPGSSATVTGYRADLEQMKVQAADSLIARFR
ncbi:MAG: HEAT repeat domain-containing protein [Deltaproteobacteria bacterium]|nr:HEAT repeat domain-containing protein [Deltaproteobacteria bacterium]